MSWSISKLSFFPIVYALPVLFNIFFIIIMVEAIKAREKFVISLRKQKKKQRLD
jgi:hypothetical protein